MQMNFYPTWGTGDVLSVILGTPTFDKAHANCAHFGEFINSFKAMVDRLAEKLGKFLIVEYLETATWRDFTYCSWMEVMMVVAVTTLDKYRTVTETLGEDFPADIVQVHTFANVPTGIFNCGVSVNI